jgi:hypothetical protein
VTPQFGASLADNSRVIIYNRNMFIVQATDVFKYKVILVFQQLFAFFKVCCFIPFQAKNDFSRLLLLKDTLHQSHLDPAKSEPGQVSIFLNFFLRL